MYIRKYLVRRGQCHVDIQVCDLGKKMDCGACPKLGNPGGRVGVRQSWRRDDKLASEETRSSCFWLCSCPISASAVEPKFSENHGASSLKKELAHCRWASSSTSPWEEWSLRGLAIKQPPSQSKFGATPREESPGRKWIAEETWPCKHSPPMWPQDLRRDPNISIPSDIRQRSCPSPISPSLLLLDPKPRAVLVSPYLMESLKLSVWGLTMLKVCFISSTR